MRRDRLIERSLSDRTQIALRSLSDRLQIAAVEHSDSDTDSNKSQVVTAGAMRFEMRDR